MQGDSEAVLGVAPSSNSLLVMKTDGERMMLEADLLTESPMQAGLTRRVPCALLLREPHARLVQV